MFSFLVFIGLFNVIYVNCEEQTGNGKHTGDRSVISLSNHKTNFNITYIDKPENILLVPSMNQNEEKQRKPYKKSPKRTIQKIIKRNKIRKRYYMRQVTTTTASYMKNDQDYQEGVTGPPNHKKKTKKYNLKVARYPYKYQGKKDYRRMKRDDKRDVFILKDFDEMKFLKADGDYDVVQSNIQKYW